MKEPCLEVTFRHGRPIAAYCNLPRGANQRSARSRRVGPGDVGAARPPATIRVRWRALRHELVVTRKFHTSTVWQK
ncbi:MAG TPA: hypothetical protein VGY48_04800 [Vicinamibacterales bacterium]|jgi:hypothetical protein|nr:hypothetical protein [Vicinamibacterales bacterium]